VFVYFPFHNLAVESNQVLALTSTSSQDLCIETKTCRNWTHVYSTVETRHLDLEITRLEISVYCCKEMLAKIYQKIHVKPRRQQQQCRSNIVERFFWQSRMLLRHCCWCKWGFKL